MRSPRRPGRRGARSASSETCATGSSWEGERIFKVVSFFLVRYERGRLGDIPDAFRHEIAEVRWLPLDEAPRLLAYKGEREMAAQALARLAAGRMIGGLCPPTH